MYKLHVSLHYHVPNVNLYLHWLIVICIFLCSNKLFLNLNLNPDLPTPEARTQTQQYNRPIRCILESTKDKDKILKNTKKICQSTSNQYDPKRIFIVLDQTALERQDHLVLRKNSNPKETQHRTELRHTGTVRSPKSLHWPPHHSESGPSQAHSKWRQLAKPLHAPLVTSANMINDVHIK